MELEAKPMCTTKCLFYQHLVQPQKARCVRFSSRSQCLSLASWNHAARAWHGLIFFQSLSLARRLQLLGVMRRLLTQGVGSWSLCTPIAGVTHRSAEDIPGLQGTLFVALESHFGNFHSIKLGLWIGTKLSVLTTGLAKISCNGICNFCPCSIKGKKKALEWSKEVLVKYLNSK